MLETKISAYELSGKEIIFNWQLFFSGAERTYPSTDLWNNCLIKELNETKDWIIKNRN